MRRNKFQVIGAQPSLSIPGTLEEANNNRNRQCERWLHNNMKSQQQFFEFYRARHDYTRMTMEEVAALAEATGENATWLVTKIGFGAERITVDQLSWYHFERRDGLELDTVMLVS
jgi:hypothetical protein